MFKIVRRPDRVPPRCARAAGRERGRAPRASAQTAELREQFIAVLGHDLRNPLASIGAGARMLRQRAARATKRPDHRRLMARAASPAWPALIDNVLDFARGRLGGGLRSTAAPTRAARARAPAGRRRAARRLAGPRHRAELDIGRAGRLRPRPHRPALLEPPRQRPVPRRTRRAGRGRARRPTAARFELSVANGGEPIPPAPWSACSSPSRRGSAPRRPAGAGPRPLYRRGDRPRPRRHAGRSTSTPDETRFTFRMPPC